MKRFTVILALFVWILSCKSPMTITANPDDQTNASGTPGSAKMTNQLPPKNNNVPVRTDTLKLPKDTSRIRQ